MAHHADLQQLAKRPVSCLNMGRIGVPNSPYCRPKRLVWLLWATLPASKTDRGNAVQRQRSFARRKMHHHHGHHGGCLCAQTALSEMHRNISRIDSHAHLVGSEIALGPYEHGHSF